jgi:zinc protease
VSRPSIGPLRAPRSPAVVETELGGGLQVVAVRRRSVPLVELRIGFPVTPAQVSKPAGPALMAASLLAGTDRHDRLGLAAAIEKLGASLNAGFRRDRFELSASVLASRLGSLLELISEVLTGASYPNDEVSADRARLADETAIALSSPEVIASEALRARLFPGHPYATPMPRPEELLRVSPAAVRRLHPVVLDPGSAHLVVVGDVTPSRARGEAEQRLGPWLENGRRSSRRLPAVPPPEPGPVVLVDRPGSVQSNLRIAASAPGRLDPDSPAAGLANLVFGGTFASRLVANLRERHGYTYSPRSGINHDRAGSWLAVQADVATAVTAQSLMETRYELARVALDGVTEAELDSARRYAVGTFSFVTATQGGLAGILSALGMAGIGPGYLQSYPAVIIRATKDEVDEAARKYLAPARMVTVVVGDAAKVAGPLASLESPIAEWAAPGSPSTGPA